MTDYRKLFDLTGKTAVVLGAASGIGKSSAEALAALGARVICADRTRRAVRKRPPPASATRAARRRQPAATRRTLPTSMRSRQDAMQKFPRLDIAVTTPGLNIRKTILDYTEEDLDRVINLNIKGTVWFFQAFGRIMVEQKGGSLIACSSVRAVTIEPGLAVYGSTKAAIGLLVKGFASEVGRFRRSRQRDRAEHRRDRADRARSSSGPTSTISMPAIPCSTAGAAPTRSRPPWPISPRMPRAMSAAARCSSTAAGPPSTGRRRA